MGLVDAGAFDHLAGRVAFIGVPAEEYGDVAWRVRQRDEGKLEFLGGKPEMLRLGHLDDVDVAMMLHATPRTEEGKLAVPVSNNGCVVKTVRYVGKAAHAGGMPHRGINALYAAQIGLAAINAVRETFRDDDTVRVHPIMTHGGSQVNVIPADVRLETFVRGKTLEAIADADRKVDRALRAGALALGAKVEIETLPGYMPMHCDATLVERFRPIAESLVGADQVRTIQHRTGSTDMGDLAQVMPIIHPYIGGAAGTSHGADWQLVDPSLVYVTNAKVLASMVVDLLADGAAVGREVVAKAKPPMTRQAYLTYQRGMSRREVYEGDR
jgi:amidohydrolase